MNDISENKAERVPWLTVERLGAISDGVIAIVVTILVLEIKVPEDHDFGSQGVLSLLSKASRDIMVYLLNFILIWVYWLQHHVMFHYVARTDRIFVLLNGLFLFLLSLSPFSTKLAGTYRGAESAEVVFAGNLFLSGVILLLMWRYAVWKEHLLRRRVSTAVVRSISRRIMVAPAVIFLGTVVSVFNFHVAALLYFAIPLFYLKHWLADTSWQSQE